MSGMVIHVTSVVTACDTGDQGEAVRSAIVKSLDASDAVTVSFRGIASATSSFVNTCFVELLATMSLDQIKHRIRVVDTTAQINDMVKWRLTSEAQRNPVAA